MLQTDVWTGPVDIASILPEIHNRIESNEDKFTSIDARSGLMGLSLYYYARAAFFQSPGDLARANGYLEKCFEMVNSGYVSRILYREIAELGWCIEICKKTGQYDGDTNEVLDDFDEILYKQVMDELESRNFDPATGALAYAFYFLDRLPSKPGVKKIIQEVAAALAALSWKNEKGRYWKSKLNDDDSVYLGISHGSAAIMAFLCKAVQAGVEIDCRELIREASAYIVSQERTGTPTFFPVIVGEGTRQSFFANHWCYGDPGTLYGLLQGALFLGDDALKNYTLDKYSVAGKRENDGTYLIAGYGLLYGHAGLAMLYHKCYEQTGAGFFAEAYREQIGLLLSNFNPCNEFLGYAGYWNQDIEVTNYTFSEGLIGIALTLMAHRDHSFSRYYRPFFYL